MVMTIRASIKERIATQTNKQYERKDDDNIASYTGRANRVNLKTW